ncbi:hypothetical protein A2U01_0064959, partial [Trifolium medium]|nr:hypothetical protein [Trifolium medium]
MRQAGDAKQALLGRQPE